MISRIEIENFQSHKHSLLEFSPGVNALLGPSDSGKTAVLRALRWVAFNKPSGDAMRSNWGGDTRVQLTLLDAHGQEFQVARVRAAKENLYQLRMPDGSEVESRAVGSDVPEIVRELLSIDDVSLQQQMDRPFLLDESPGQVAAYLNRVANLDHIDRASSNVSRWVRGLSGDIAQQEQLVQTYEARLSAYEFLPDLDQQLEQCEVEARMLAGHRQQALHLEQLVSTGERLCVRLRSGSRMRELVGQAEQLTDAAAAVQRKHEQQRALNSLLTQAQRVRLRMANLPALQTAQDACRELLLEASKQAKTRERLQGLQKAVNRVDQLARAGRRLEKDINALRQQFAEEMPNVCALCGQEVPHEAHA